MIQFQVDGKTYPNLYIVSMKRRFYSVVDGSITLHNGETRNNVIGYATAYDIVIDTDASSPADYTAFVNKLSEPLDVHDFVLPADDGSISFRGRFATASDDLLRHWANQPSAWGNLAFAVEPIKPQREALSLT